MIKAKRTSLSKISGSRIGSALKTGAHWGKAILPLALLSIATRGKAQTSFQERWTGYGVKVTPISLTWQNPMAFNKEDFQKKIMTYGVNVMFPFHQANSRTFFGLGPAFKMSNDQTYRKDGLNRAESSLGAGITGEIIRELNKSFGVGVAIEGLYMNVEQSTWHDNTSPYREIHKGIMLQGNGFIEWHIAVIQNFRISLKATTGIGIGITGQRELVSSIGVIIHTRRCSCYAYD